MAKPARPTGEPASHYIFLPGNPRATSGPGTRDRSLDQGRSLLGVVVRLEADAGCKLSADHLRHQESDIDFGRGDPLGNSVAQTRPVVSLDK